MILGSHNSMTYLTPRNMWACLIRWTAQCQNKSLKEQFDAGVRVFDLRIAFRKKGLPVFAHGLFDYEGNPFFVLTILNRLSRESGEQVYVRIINERDKDKDYFVNFCDNIKDVFLSLKFFGGVNKKDWSLLYDFGTELPAPLMDKYSSWDAELGRPHWLNYILYPRIYAILFNKKNHKRFTNEDVILMQDFV